MDLEKLSMRRAIRQVLNDLPVLPCATQRGIGTADNIVLCLVLFAFTIDSSHRHSIFNLESTLE